MAATQTLQTIISINARTGNGFSAVGATLTELGAMVDGLSQELISFGKDSIEVYRNYEKSIKDTEVALSTVYGRGTRELSAVMGKIDEQATEWAASSIFHTNDVANAISEAAHAGWDYNQILSGIPAAMQLAQAGGLDLSEAVNYIVKSTTAAGVAFEDLSDFTDLWAFAANSSASTIGEFGEAMLRMGSTMRFTGSTEELMTLLAVTANAGTVGSEAGTMIRNTMLRLIAPTDKAAEEMALLGATSEEAAELLDDEALAAANAELAARGFSAYNANGELKDMLDIYRELYVALADIAGGYEGIDRNQEALQVLAAIFPTRTITEALTLLRSAAEGYDGLYEAMLGGAAQGYGEYAAETMMDTLDGRIETFLSKVERLKQLAGEELSGPVGDALSGLGGIVDSIAGLDEDKFSALVSGLEAIGITGPSLILAGTAFRGIGSMMTPMGSMAMAAAASAALLSSLRELKEADFSNGFGLAEMDRQAISSYLSGLGEDFKGAYEEIDAFRQAVDGSVESYKTASEAFTGELLTDMLTGETLSGEDISRLEGLGADMHDAVINGIKNSAAGSMSFFEMLFGGAGTAEENPEYRDIIDLTNTVYLDSIAQAEQVGKDLRAAMTKAFEDGQVSEEEYQEILNLVRAYNDAAARASAEAKSEQDYINEQILLRRAQTASLDELREVAGEIREERDRVLAEAEETYLNERYKLQYRYDQAIGNGTLVNGKAVTGEDRDAALAALDQQYQQHILNQSEHYDGILYNMWDSQIKQSDYAEAYGRLGEMADRVLSGALTLDSAISMFDGSKELGRLLWEEMEAYGGFEALEGRIKDYTEKGDAESANKVLRLYAMKEINDNYGLWNANAEQERLGNRRDFVSFLEGYTQDAGAYTVEDARNTAEAFGEVSAFFETIGKEALGKTEELELFRASSNLSENAKNEIDRIMQQMRQNYDLDRVLEETAAGTPFADPENAMRGYYAAYQLMSGGLGQDPEQYRIQAALEIDPDASLQPDPVLLPVEPDVEENGMADLQLNPVSLPVEPDIEEDRIADLQLNPATLPVEPDIEEDGIASLQLNPVPLLLNPRVEWGDGIPALQLGPVPLPVEPYVEGEDRIAALREQGVQVQVSGDTQQLHATIDGEDGQNLMAYVDGDATGLEAEIWSQDGLTLLERVTGDASALAALISSYNGRTVTVNVAGQKMFASGGRATTASVFGEAGPEWAIPEEHSERTAELLNAARAASGFTWPELLQRYGGLNAQANAGAGSGGMMIVYSPVINANDAAGVEEVLREDKKRFERWFEEKRMRDEMEVYQ